jgi:hypothetical protein
MDSLLKRALKARDRRVRRFTWPVRIAVAACLAIIAGSVAYNYYQSRRFLQSVVAHVEESGPGVSVHRRGRVVIAVVGMPLAVGDRIETADEQAVSFTYAGDTTRVRIREETALHLQESDGGKRLFLERGAIEADVAPQAEDAPMVITTPHAEMTVRGTAFSVTATEDTTGLKVREGTVSMALAGRGEGEDVEDGHVAFAKAGLDRLIVPGKLIKSIPITGLPPGTVVSGAAIAGKDVWVHGSSDRDGATILARVDAATGAVKGTVELRKPFIPASCLTWKKDLLWGFARDGMSLQGIDVRTGEVAQTIPVPVAETSSQRIFDIQGEFAWFRGRVREEVIKIDLDSGAVLQRVMCPFAVDRIAASADAVYAGEDGWAACKIDPREGRVSYGFMCEGESVTGDMACDDGARLWTVTGTRAEIHVFEAE